MTTEAASLENLLPLSSSPTFLCYAHFGQVLASQEPSSAALASPSSSPMNHDHKAFILDDKNASNQTQRNERKRSTRSWNWNQPKKRCKRRRFQKEWKEVCLKLQRWNGMWFAWVNWVLRFDSLGVLLFVSFRLRGVVEWCSGFGLTCEWMCSVIWVSQILHAGGKSEWFSEIQSNGFSIHND